MKTPEEVCSQSHLRKSEANWKAVHGQATQESLFPLRETKKGFMVDTPFEVELEEGFKERS